METIWSAIKNSDLAAIQNALESGIDPSQLDSSGKLLIHEAAVKNHRKMVELLVKYGADVNQADGLGQRALASAAFRGYLNMVKCLLENGAQIDETSSLDGTALFWACCGGHFEVIRCLLEAGSKIDQATKDGQTPLGRATSGVYSANALEIVRFLIEHGAPINQVDQAGRSALMNSALGGRLKMVEYLLEAGADPQLRSHHNETSINFVCQARDENPAVLKVLLNAGTDADAIDTLYHIGPLRQAAVKNHALLVAELLRNGAAINGLSHEGQSPLCGAAQQGAVDSVRVLIEQGADVEFAGQNSDGSMREDESPLMASLRRHHNEVAVLLIESGANVNRADPFGVTPLLMALGYYDAREYERSNPPEISLPIIQLLLKKGADIDLPSPGSAFKWVQKTKNTRLIGLIKKG